MEFRSWFVRSFVRWCPPFLFVLHYSTNFLKFFPPISLTLSLSSGLTSENVSKKNSPQEAHVSARSKQSTPWEIVNKFTNSIVSTYAQGRPLKNCRGEEKNNAIDRRRELWNEMDAVDCERVRERENFAPRFYSIKRMTRNISNRNLSNVSKQCATPRVKSRERPFTKTWRYSQ